MKRQANVADCDRELLADLVAANRILSDQKIVDAFGHISVCHDKGPSAPPTFLAEEEALKPAERMTKRSRGE